VSLTVGQLFATATKAIQQVWEESSETATQTEAFPPRDKHGKSPKVAADDKATEAASPKRAPPPKAAVASGHNHFSPRTQHAPKAGAGTESAPASPAKPAAPSKKCSNCDKATHTFSKCDKPCKFYASGACKFGRKCALGPTDVNKHGDLRQ
jgi:hypothetical protein